MPFLDQIVTNINKDLKAGPLADPRFQSGRIEAIATQALIRDNGPTDKVFLPLIYKQSGDYDEVTFDDIYPIIIYHRVLDGNIQEIAGGDYGRDQRKEKDVTIMQMVVMAFRDKVNMSKEALQALILCNLPYGNTDAYNVKPLQSCFIKKIGYNMDSLSVFMQEFKGLDVNLNPEKMIFSIKYKIESTYLTGCFNICDCVSSNS